MFLKLNKFVIAVLSSLLLASGVIADEFAPGGVSFDFQKISDQRFKNKPQNSGENIIGNSDFPEAVPGMPYENWGGRIGVHIKDAELSVKLRDQIKDLIVFKRIELPEGRCGYIKKPLELENICSGNTVSVSGSWLRYVKMPDAAGGRYNISFKYKGETFGKFETSCYLIVGFKDGSGKTPWTGVETGKTKVIKFSNPKQEWQQFPADFEVPLNTVWIELTLRIQGTGEIYFNDIQMRKIVNDMPLSICLSPMAFLDNTFCLSQNDPAVMVFAWRSNLSKGMIECKQPVLSVELPESVQVKAIKNGSKLISSEPETINGKAYRLHKIDVSYMRKGIPSEEYDLSSPHSLLVFTDNAPDSALSDGFYWVSDGDKQLTNKESFHLKVLPSIRLSARPDIFMNGFYVNGPYMDFPYTENKELLARFVGGTGAAWIISGRCDPEMTEIYRRNGIKIITPELYWIANGYRIGKAEGKPEYAKFKSLGKSKDENIENGTCPVAVYNESEYFKKSVMPYLETNLKGFDGLWSNWEPYMFNGMGCFCDNCRDEFIKFSKLPADELKAAWPREMTIGKKYYDLCTKFRSYQHARMMKVINKAVNSVTTGKAGFVPGIAWNDMTDSPAGREYCKEVDPLDYADTLKYIEPWGPYVFWPAMKPYSYTKGLNLSVFAGARKVRDFTNKNFKNPQGRPMLHALPHGIQLDCYVTQPEAITMDIISFFLNHFAASSTYHFPRGYDNRYWAGQAEASRVIAEYEKYVFKGNNFDGFSAIPVTPYPAPVKKALNYFPGIQPVDMLQTAGFKYDGKYLAAVGNFWERSDVFFKLSVNGLNKDALYALTQPDNKRYFADENKDYFTGAELEKGVILHAGALRWAFFVVEPFIGKVDYGRKITAVDVTAAMNNHLPKITRAADIEKKIDAEAEAENKKSELRSVSSGNLSCNPVNNAQEEQLLQFKSGDNELLLSLNGMVVKNWRISKNEFVAKDSNLNVGLGLPAFWSPPAMIIAPYHVKKLEATESGIMIIAERAVSAKESVELEYITVRQKIEVNTDCSAVKFETELLNTTSDETGPRNITVGFRYHNLPRYIGDGGFAVMKDNGRELVYNRKFERTIFAMQQAAASTGKMKKLFEIAVPEIRITAPEATFVSKDSKQSVSMLLSPESIFAGFACWDTPSLQSPSFEPFFNPVTIKSRESAKYSMLFELKKSKTGH